MSSTRPICSIDLVLYLLIATDLAFGFIHLVHIYSPWANDWLFSIEDDRSYAELFQYIKYLWLVLLLVSLAVLRRAFVYLGWSSVFAYLLLDDAFKFHENTGTSLSILLDLPWFMGLRPDDLGELIVAGTVGAVVILLVGFGYWKSGPEQRAVSRQLGLLLCALAVFSVLVDMLHMSLHWSMQPTSVWAVALTILEDGGELVVVSFMLYVSMRHWLTVSGANAKQAGSSTVSTSAAVQR